MRRRTLLLGSLAILGILLGLVISAYRLTLPLGLRTSLGQAAAATDDAATSASNGPCLAIAPAIRTDAPAVAFLADGRLQRLSLRGCRDRVLLTGGAVAPVRVSADGRWVGSGAGIVAPVSGGQVQRPLGDDVFDDALRDTWVWSPTGHALAGITTQGGVVVSSPGQRPRTLEPGGFGASQVVLVTDRLLVVVRNSASVWEIGLAGAAAKEIYQDPARQAQLTLAASLDGSVVFWRQPFPSASAAADGDPLLALDLHTHRVRRLFRSVLLSPGFVARCGAGLVVASDGGRVSTLGKSIVVISPDWRTSVVGYGVAPSCSADGRTVAYAEGNYEHGYAFGDERRRIWVEHLVPSKPGEPSRSRRSGRNRPIAAGGTLTVGWRYAVDPPPASGPGADEPILSPDGRVVLWVQSQSERLDAPDGPLSHGALRAAVAAKPRIRTGPLASLGTATDYYGTWSWAETVAGDR